MTNRFDKFADKANVNKETPVTQSKSVAGDILNAGKQSVIDIADFKMPPKPKSVSKSYYMRTDVHQKLKDAAEANDVGASEFLEYLLKKVFKIQD